MFRFRVYCVSFLFFSFREHAFQWLFFLRDFLISEEGDCGNDIEFKSRLGKLNDLKIGRIFR